MLGNENGVGVVFNQLKVEMQRPLRSYARIKLVRIFNLPNHVTNNGYFQSQVSQSLSVSKK